MYWHKKNLPKIDFAQFFGEKSYHIVKETEGKNHRKCESWYIFDFSSQISPSYPSLSESGECRSGTLEHFLKLMFFRGQHFDEKKFKMGITKKTEEVFEQFPFYYVHSYCFSILNH